MDVVTRVRDIDNIDITMKMTGNVDEIEAQLQLVV
jgi:hypothetical protein